MKTGPTIIVAVDAKTIDAALDLAILLDPKLCRLKIGMELFTAKGPAVIESLTRRGFDIFLDMKFSGEPQAVKGAVQAAASLGVWMISVQTLGGRAMLEAAMEGASQGSNGSEKPIIVGETIPLHIIPHDLYEIGLDISAGLNNDTIRRAVKQLTMLACVSGLDGVICSGDNIASLRQDFPPSFVFMNPMATLETIIAGADHLVIGDPIANALDPSAALRTFYQRIVGEMKK